MEGRKPIGGGFVMGMVIGMALGFAYGVALDMPTLGLLLGTTIGAAIGWGFEQGKIKLLTARQKKALWILTAIGLIFLFYFLLKAVFKGLG